MTPIHAVITYVEPDPEEDDSPSLPQPDREKKCLSWKRHCLNCCFWIFMLIAFIVIVATISLATHRFIPQITALVRGSRSICVTTHHTPPQHHQRGNPRYSRSTFATRRPECPGGLTLKYEYGKPTSFTFDLCAVIDCGGRNSSYRGYDVYICEDKVV